MFARPCQGRVTSRFDLNRLHPIDKVVRPHCGTDFGSDGSNIIRASAGGTVTRAREMGGFGNAVTIHHELGGKHYETVYAHLKYINVKTGAKVKQGQQIGVKGSTGASTGVHLHFEIHPGSYVAFNKNAVDPMMWLPLEVALKKGDKGPNVLEVQKELVRIGYLKTADGVFGPTTHTAVISFQNVFKLTSDGIIGPATLKAIKAVKPVTKPAPAKPKPVDTKVLKYGFRGTGVKDMQLRLASIYFYPNKSAKDRGCDGYFGAKTVSALKRFQSIHTPKSVDGIYGPATRKALEALTKTL